MIELLDLDFFIPNKNIVEYVTQKYSRIVEVGAGRGFFASIVSQKIDVFAFDSNVRATSLFPVSCLSVEEYPFNIHDIVFICRPCHGCFVANLVSACKSAGIKFFYYVGLAKNFEIDIHEPYDIIMTNVGKDGESLLKVHL